MFGVTPRQNAVSEHDGQIIYIAVMKLVYTTIQSIITILN